MKRFWLPGVIVVVVGVCGAVYLWLSSPVIPGNIKSQLTSTLLLPTLPQARIDRSSFKYDSNLKLLTFTAKIYGIETVISEEPTPESFVDSPQSYTDVVNSMNDSLDFDTALGQVSLTRPSQLNGKQAAVLNTKGTLLFAKPNQTISDDNWRRFFDSLQVTQ